jgi:hypothetical protein
MWRIFSVDERFALLSPIEPEWQSANFQPLTRLPPVRSGHNPSQTHTGRSSHICPDVLELDALRCTRLSVGITDKKPTSQEHKAYERDSWNTIL